MANNETCINCGKEILAMAMKGTGTCSENCRKAMVGEVPTARAQTDAGITQFNIQNEEVNARGIH